MHFATPWALLLLLVVPPLAWWSGRPSRRATLTFPTVGPLRKIPRGWRAHLGFLRPLVRAGSMSLFVVALARPQHGIGRIETSTDAVAIQIVIDRSGSMAQEMDFDGKTTSRIDAVKRVLREFVVGNKSSGGDLAGRHADLIGLVAFARYAETVCPLVRDPETLADLADAMELARERWEDGTAIGDGIALAAARLQRAEEDLKARPESRGKDLRIKSKIIVLFTDGENNAGETSPLDAAQMAAQWGVKIYPIAIGTGPAWQTISNPILGTQRIKVPSSVDTRLLRQIAGTTGGMYQSADDGDALREVYAAIDRLEKTSVETVQFMDFEERFTPWALAGLSGLWLEVVLTTLILRRAP
jgi:Ca-activated chloride channel family protein